MYSLSLTPAIRLLVLISTVCLVIGTIQSARAQLSRLSPDDALAEIGRLEAGLANPATRTLSPTQWMEYGKRISEALASEHDGLRQGALRMIIQYGEVLDLDRTAATEVVKVYRNHRNNRLRRMAVVALGQIQEPWSMDFLRRSIPYEKTPSVRHTVANVVSEYYQSRTAGVEVGEPKPVR